MSEDLQDKFAEEKVYEGDALESYGSNSKSAGSFTIGAVLAYFVSGVAFDLGGDRTSENLFWITCIFLLLTTVCGGLAAVQYILYAKHRRAARKLAIKIKQSAPNE